MFHSLKTYLIGENGYKKERGANRRNVVTSVKEPGQGNKQ